MEVTLIVIAWHEARYFQLLTPHLHHHTRTRQVQNVDAVVVQESITDVRRINSNWLNKWMEG